MTRAPVRVLTPEERAEWAAANADALVPVVQRDRVPPAPNAEKRWRKTLNAKQRAKLDGAHLSKWAHGGGNFFVPSAPPTKKQTRQRREREQLKHQREARLRAAREAYEKVKNPTA